ncbi:MAG TPA: S-methyl-5-thioribose-1-phosphate isomerase [Gemmatimonadaceae bacterium]|nr:S-methyl-5-thioribose-1-phosphate isomerase [Gemmatimonadaceae bacterium]
MFRRRRTVDTFTPVHPIQAVRWAPDSSAVRIIDQTALPERLIERDLRSLDDVCTAISSLAVRGAPAIGIAGAMGLVASLGAFDDESVDQLRGRIAVHAHRIVGTRPTAANLAWAVHAVAAEAMRPFATAAEALRAMHDTADALLAEDGAMCRRIGELGESLLADGARVLTHCNAGALATTGIGTALAPVYVAAEHGRRVLVLACETRPLLQGARLTAWELSRAGVPVRVITDGAAAAAMRDGRVDLVIVGADRIAANGDVANKIGTYALALAARHHGIPFYVAAPTSTFDAAIASGADIPIEQRGRGEVACIAGRAIVPNEVPVENPAFDVTPAELVTAIVSDRGIHRPPYRFDA